MNDPILILENIEKHFGNVAVLRGVSAVIPRGSVTAFVGPNGAGKTTLFHAISGDLCPDKGTVVLRGKEISGLAPWKVARLGLGKLFQDVRIFENLSLIENVLLALHDHNGRSAMWSLLRAPFRAKLAAAQEEKSRHWLEAAGVEKPFDRPAGLLSFGNRKLLALARLLAGGFDLLLLDEPTAGVSPSMVDRMETMVRKMVSEEGKTVMLIEHNFSFVSAVADQVYVLRDGTVHDSGKTDDVLGREDNREILIGL